jgi:ABC-type proline/glycine betaine transport system substrate-binding protein
MKDKPSLENIGYDVTVSEVTTPTTISSEVNTKIDKIV